jgi:hypothetical protein
MTPAVKAELAELRAKVRELSADLHDEQRQNASAVDPSDLVQGDETAPLDCTIEFHWQWRIDAGDAYQHNRARARWTVNPTWNDVLKHLGPELMDEASEEYLRERLSALCDGLARDDLIKDDDNDDDDTDAETDADKTSGDDEADEAKQDDRVGRIYDVEVTIESFNDVKVQFSALGLIEKGSKRRPGSDTSTYWRLTDRGHQQLLRLRAVRKPVLVETERDAVEGSTATE